MNWDLVGAFFILGLLIAVPGFVAFVVLRLLWKAGTRLGR
jgi:hypothetical protein